MPFNERFNHPFNQRFRDGIPTPAQTGVHILGDSFASVAMQTAVNARISNWVATVDGVGGTTLADQATRFDSTPQFYDDALTIMDGALELDTAPAIVAIDSMAAHVAGARYLYVKPGLQDFYTWDNPDRQGWETEVAALAAHVGALHFVETWNALFAGNDGSVNDLIDVANRVIPRSLRADNIHPNTAGYAIWAREIVSVLVANGWAIGTGEPLCTTKPVVTGAQTVGAVNSCTTGAWAYAPSGYTYQWKRTGANISGATASTYTRTSDDTDELITCVVTATNGTGSNWAVSNTLGTPSVVYTTLNPSDLNHGVLSNGNLSFADQLNGQSNTVRCVTPIPAAGRYQAEFTIDATPGAVDDIAIGIMSNAGLFGNYTFSDAGGQAAGWFNKDGFYYGNCDTTYQTDAALATVGTKVVLWADTELGRLWIKVGSGNINGRASGESPATGSGGAGTGGIDISGYSNFFAFISVNRTGTAVTANFGASTPTVPLTTGYTRWIA